jgi:hypothetical protein
MRALNKISILDCDEAEHGSHMAETERIFEKIYSIKNYNCLYTVEYVDEYHRENRDKYVANYDLQSLSDVLDGTDFKNGMDVYINEGDLVFLVHGQGYERLGEYLLVETKVTVQAFDNYGAKVDMGRFFLDKKRDRIEPDL